MKNSLLFCLMITLLVLCSAFFIRSSTYKKCVETVAVMSYNTEREDVSGITFTDLAQRVNSIITGVKA